MPQTYGNDLIEACAQAAHEVNRVWSRSNGDESHAHWEEAPDWQKASSREGVLTALRMAEQGFTAEQAAAKLHEAWMHHKTADGWRYGPTKNAETKEHPCMVPYADLAPDQRIKDDIYFDVVLSVARNWWRRSFG